MGAGPEIGPTDPNNSRPSAPTREVQPASPFFMDGKFTASRRWSRRRRLLLQRLGKVPATY